jgi:hypothetical protein
MAMIQIRVALAASTTVFPLQGTRYEIAPFDASIELAAQADATGVLLSFGTGTDAVQDEGPVQVGTINVQAKYPDDFHIADVAAAGERLFLQLRDTSGAARVVMLSIKENPV